MIVKKMESGLSSMRAVFNRLRNGYVKFVEKQGFPIIVTLCIAVITATAVWTGRKTTAYVSPTPPVNHDVSAAQLIQQTLREAVTPTPVPTDAPRSWRAPMDEVTILRPYNAETMVHSGVTGIWSLHDAIDIKAARGAKVYAISDGTIVDSGRNEMSGEWLLVDHGDGIEALYAGMALNNDYVAGDKVRAGDTIGFSGSGPMDETDLEPHLHLRVTDQGAAVNPVTLWNGQS